MDCIERLKKLDYSHKWTTAPKHIIEIYLEAKKYEGKNALEVGSFKGHASLAICLAGMNLTYYDLDKRYQRERDRLLEGFNVKYYIEEGRKELKKEGKYDLIFHDSYHGDKVIPELVAFYYSKLNDKGVLIVHDVNALSLRSLLRQFNECDRRITKDRRGRQLGFFYI